MLIASGWTPLQAEQQLLATHDAGAPDHWSRPSPVPETTDLSRVGKLGRKPIRPSKTENATIGHPLEGLE